MRSAPHKRFSPSICRISVILSDSKGDGRLFVADFRVHSKRKRWRCQSKDRFRLDQQQSLAPCPDFAGQQNKQLSFLPFQFHPLDLAFQRNQLLL